MFYVKDVSLTGIDAHTDLNRLLELTHRFPNVMWAVLVSYKQAGNNPRYPTLERIKEIGEFVKKHNLRRKFALHICGKPAVSDFFNGTGEVTDLLQYFLHVQINFRFKDYAMLDIAQRFDHLQFSNRIITQYNDANKDLWEPLLNQWQVSNNALLVDFSGGNGVFRDPTESLLNAPFNRVVTFGIAGGYGLDNIQQVLETVKKVETKYISSDGVELEYNRSIWIDMETKLRNEQDIFDLDICEKILTIHDNFYKGAT